MWHSVSGLKDASTRYTAIGGNVPQSLVNQACLDIQAGRADIVLITGAETWRTRTKLRRGGGETQLDASPSRYRWHRDPTKSWSWPAAELRIKLDRPAYVYPMFEQSLRIAAGETSEDHRRRIGELWSQFSAVAATNPHAWSREPLSGKQICSCQTG